MTRHSRPAQLQVSSVSWLYLECQECRGSCACFDRISFDATDSTLQVKELVEIRRLEQACMMKMEV